LQNPSHTNGHNLNNVKRETRRTSRNNNREYLKHKINEHKTNNKNKNITDLYRGLHVFKEGYHPRSNLRDENDDLLENSPQYFEGLEELFVSY
jgi:hypothetical protein